MTTLPAIPTRSAHWGWDEHQYFGHAVFGELAGNEGLTGMLALSVLGRRLARAECAILDDAAVCLTLADPRIWPLKLTRVVASFGAPLAASAAGLLVQEAARIGASTVTRAAEVLILFSERPKEAPAVAEAPTPLEQAVEEYLAVHTFIWGFGTPFRGKDERLVAYQACLEGRERTHLPYYRLFLELSEVVVRLRGVQPNMALALAATFLDLGLNSEDCGRLAAALMQHMFFAHGIGGASENPEVLRALPPTFVRFSGRTPRKSPRASADDAEG